MVTLTLFKKEMLYFWRSSKWIWLPITFIVLAILQPLTIYYMPEILNATGSLPDGAIFEMPTPTANEIIVGVLSQFNMVGVVIVVAAVMGTINAERQRGTMSLIMSRPVKTWQYVMSKWFAENTILFISLLLGYVLSAYYTSILFAELDYVILLKSFVVYYVWIAFIITLTTLCSTLFKNNGAIMGVSIVVVAILALLDSLIAKFMKWSPSMFMTEASNILLENKFSDSIFITIVCSIVIIVVLIAVTIAALNKQERY